MPSTRITRSRARLRALAALLFAATAMAASQSHATKTYLIDESTDFTGNGCENVDLNDVTSQMQAQLDSGGFTGIRWVNPSAWPQDFMESCSTTFGPDGSDVADTQVVSVYAGHGNVGLLQWGAAHNGRCTLDFSANMRLGSMAHSTSAIGVYVTSCTLKIDTLPAEANFEWERQQFGFHNSPSVGDGDPANFAWCTGISPPHNSAYCWGAYLEDKPGWWTGDNSPVAVSYGTNSTDCQNTQNNARIKADVLNFNRGGGPSCNQGQPSFWYCYSWIDHGTSPACG